MNKVSRGNNPVELELLGAFIEEWRNGERKGRSMPEHLWAAAAGLAEELGVSRVSRSLGLSYDSLKKRLPVERSEEESGTGSGVEFVELEAGEVFPGATWGGMVIEMTDRYGRRLTIRLSGGDQVDVAALLEAVWGAGR